MLSRPQVDLGWFARHADEIKTLIDKLNGGKPFHGGDKTSLQHDYKRGIEECLQ